MWQYNNLDELYHYGILGMRWGHRKSYKNYSKRLFRPHKRNYTSKDYNEVKRLNKKKLNQLSNDQIKIINKRKQLETDYKRLNKGKIAKGMAIVGSTAAFTASVITIKNNAPKLIDDGKNAVKLIKNSKFK